MDCLKDVASYWRVQPSTYAVPERKNDCKIKDYGIIGDCRSAALVSSHGAIDWLCWPRFDSPAIFAALLDRDLGGEWSIAPTGPFQSTRRYRGDSNVLLKLVGAL